MSPAPRRASASRWRSSCLAAGATVAGVARSEDDLARVAETLGDRFRPTPADVSDADAIAAAIDEVAADLGRLDVLVNNAGLGRFDAVDALDLELWRAQIDVNLSGAFYATRAAVPHMKEAGRGHIVARRQHRRARRETPTSAPTTRASSGCAASPRRP